MLGVVLAGGRSRRMGQDKSQLTLPNGLTQAEHAEQLLYQAGCSQVVICGPHPGWLPDRLPHLGPLGAIETVMHKMRPDKMLVIPVDMPMLTPALLRRLRTRPPKGKARIFRGFPLPILLSVTPECKKIIRRLLEQPEPGKRSLKTLLEHIDYTELKISEIEQKQLQNINTPEQWEEIYQRLARRGQQHGS